MGAEGAECMVIGIGTDLLKAERITSVSIEDRFFEAVFTEKEREQAFENRDPLRYYASHFSGKEAAFKALNAHPDHIRLNEIEILNDNTGRPQVRLFGAALDHARKAGIARVLISLSWETDYCSAFAVAESE